MTTTRTEYNGWSIIERTGTYKLNTGEVTPAKLTTRVTDGVERNESLHILDTRGHWMFSRRYNKFTPDAEPAETEIVTADTRVPARFLAEPAAYAENRRRNDREDLH